MKNNAKTPDNTAREINRLGREYLRLKQKEFPDRGAGTYALPKNASFETVCCRNKLIELLYNRLNISDARDDVRIREIKSDVFYDMVFPRSSGKGTEELVPLLDKWNGYNPNTGEESDILAYFYGIYKRRLRGKYSGLNYSVYRKKRRTDASGDDEYEYVKVREQLDIYASDDEGNEAYTIDIIAAKENAGALQKDEERLLSGAAAAGIFRILTDAVKTINSLYENRRTINYSRLFYTETGVKFFRDCDSLDEFTPQEKDFFGTADVSFSDHITATECRTLRDYTTAEYRYGFPLENKVFISYLGEKAPSEQAVSQQRVKYRELIRTKLGADGVFM